jgi:hypothetical protein
MIGREFAIIATIAAITISIPVTFFPLVQTQGELATKAYLFSCSPLEHLHFRGNSDANGNEG